MSYRPLSRRIILAFVVVVTIVSGLFSIGIIFATRFVEEELIADNLHADLSVAIADLNAGRDIELAPGLSFYHDSDEHSSSSDDLPDWLSHLHSGIHEVFREDQAFNALVYKQGKERFLLLKDQTNYEKREHIMFMIVFAGFLLSVGFAWLLGHLLAKHVMVPVVRLASAVGHLNQLHADAPPIAIDYADDEIGKLASAFDGTLGELRDALQRERFFTNDVSHELRTPLMIITSSCELLTATNNLSPKQHEQLARIRRASIEMHDLVKTFLLLARDSLQQDTDTDAATLETIAMEQYEHWRGIAENKGLIMQLNVLHANNTQYKKPLLRALIANLLRNAVHYTDTGFVKLIVDGSTCRVEDSGQGIEPEQRETVFQPFVRGTQARGEGMGLGLSLVKRICQHENWRIELTPLQPQGSCFTVDFNPPK